VNNKALGGLVAIVGVALAVVGWVLWSHLTFASKKLDVSLGLGVILAIVGIVMLVMPAPKKA
jgi:hypothetical protein